VYVKPIVYRTRLTCAKCSKRILPRWVGIVHGNRTLEPSDTELDGPSPKMTLTPAAWCPMVGGKAAATVVIARKRKKHRLSCGGPAENEKTTHAEHVYRSGWVGGGWYQKGCRRENHWESTSGRRTTNRPLMRGPDEHVLRVMRMHSAGRAAYLLRGTTEGMGTVARTGGWQTRSNVSHESRGGGGYRL